MNLKWLGVFLSSTIGKKIIMSLTGLFLVLFLLEHLAGNLLLLMGDGGATFNIYAHYASHNPIIGIIEYLLYFFLILHAVQGIYIKIQDKKARGPVSYKQKKGSGTSWASRNMALLGILIFAFLCLHMGDFWFKVKFGDIPIVDGYGDLYSKVAASFSVLWIVIAYLIGLLALAFHLYHGFDSAFKTLGVNHPKWTPIIKGLGTLISILIPIGFAIIPLVMYAQSA